MRKILKEIKIFDFEELKEETQKKVVEDFKSDLIDENFNIFRDDIYMYLEEMYKMVGYEVEYDLSYCQGDGLCFYNNRYNLLSYTVLKNNDLKNANVLEKYIIENNFNNDLLLEYLGNDYNLGIFKIDSSYTHARTCKIDYEYYYNNDDEEEKAINDYITYLIDKLEKLYINICNELEKIGYSCYDVTEEDVKECINANGYEFLENGEIY